MWWWCVVTEKKKKGEKPSTQPYATKTYQSDVGLSNTAWMQLVVSRWVCRSVSKQLGRQEPTHFLVTFCRVPKPRVVTHGRATWTRSRNIAPTSALKMRPAARSWSKGYGLCLGCQVGKPTYLEFTLPDIVSGLSPSLVKGLTSLSEFSEVTCIAVGKSLPSSLVQIFGCYC